MSKHTPRPWRVECGQDIHAGDSAEDRLIAQFHAGHREERRANATLCAAAPELLDALEDLLAAFDSTVAAGRSGVAPAQGCHYRDAARSAIRKARGEL